MKRFILLKDNRIIDTIRYDGYRKINFEGENYCVLVPIFSCNDKIIKETDRIIDLIEVGDLVEHIYNGNKYTSEIVKIDKYNNEVDLWILGIVLNFDDITKIYKSNQNEGYDLAWEREQK